MTKQTPEPAAPKRMSLAQKIALASGAGAAITGIVAPQSADAVPIQSTTLPLSPPATRGFTYWDVDGDGTTEFWLRHQTSTSSLRTYRQASLTEPGPSRFVSPASRINDGFAKLNAGFNVSGSLVTGYKFMQFGQPDIQITTSGSIGSDAGQQGWSIGDIGYFGFKFSNGSDVHYGWGQISITGTPKGQGFTFTEAYYNSDPNAPIAVGDRGTAVPEIDPASAGSVMSLVIGSLAMLERRRKLRAADASPTTVSA